MLGEVVVEVRIMDVCTPDEVRPASEPKTGKSRPENSAPMKIPAGDGEIEGNWKEFAASLIQVEAMVEDDLGPEDSPTGTRFISKPLMTCVSNGTVDPAADIKDSAE